jgi:hypothetical protein
MASLTPESPLELAKRRLDGAIDVLEAAINRRREEDRNRSELEAQIHAFGGDRSRLAAELDRERSLAGELERANREVSERLEQAAETIRAVLSDSAAEPHEPGRES